VSQTIMTLSDGVVFCHHSMLGWRILKSCL